MGLFDIFTGRPQRQAAEQQRQYFNQLQNQVTNQLGQAQTTGLEALQSGQYGALGAIQPAIETARSDIQGAVDPALAALSGGISGATGAIGAGTGAGAEAILSGMGGQLEAYDPLRAAADRYSASQAGYSGLSADALGLNGPEGIARARSSFIATPGYNFNLEQGLEGLLRQSNRLGMPAGGNLLQESQRFGSGLASQEYNNWLNNVVGQERMYAPLEANVLSGLASGVSGIYGAGSGRLADLYSGGGRSIAELLARGGAGAADIYGGAGRSLADLASRGGLASADIFRGTGQDIANLVGGLARTGVGFSGQLAQPYANTYMNAANAQTAGSGNLWNLLGGMAGGVFGGPIGAGLGSSLGSGLRLASTGGFNPVGGYG